MRPKVLEFFVREDDPKMSRCSSEIASVEIKKYETDTNVMERILDFIKDAIWDFHRKGFEDKDICIQAPDFFWLVFERYMIQQQFVVGYNYVPGMKKLFGATLLPHYCNEIVTFVKSWHPDQKLPDPFIISIEFK
jgi:hypothetical protein